MIGSYETVRDNMTHVDCWYSQNDICAPHFHSSIELTYVLSGQLMGWVNGEEHALNAHELLLCPCYSLHYYETKDASRSIVLTVPMETIPFFQKLLRTNSFQSITAKLPAQNELLHCLKQLIAAPKENAVLRKGYAYAVMGILSDLLKLQPVKGSAAPNFARDILLYLEDSFLLPLDVRSVAEHFGYSRGHFSYIFSQSFGFTFGEYLSILRCRHAAMLLTNSSASLIEISMNCGFGSIRTFYRSFKHVYGMTTTQYLSAHTADGPDRIRGLPAAPAP